ncbi:YaiO family outer membrane beta-barrel protein [Cognatilysobacter bugurensis]|uniref:YaiO family outer membrane beta-barrel protein n=1 Tax=Cognatilysobacter bugurensis TaxID=543356 RepID=A0A918WAY1_9GAMM|nr:YaiO family outer membrane beta-barrel protein [Lysobacter bugurensis]GHA87555.1 hypothetical protein GCM10007067_26910 [Lysobacter bugurensis]
MSLHPALLACALVAATGAQAQPPAAGPTASATPVQAASAQLARRDWAAARTTLEQHLARSPDDDEARFLLARVRAWQGQPEAALPLYRALLERAPDNADYLLGYGLAQLWAGQRDAAIATLERAHALAPDYADVDRALARARAANPGSSADPTAVASSPPTDAPPAAAARGQAAGAPAAPVNGAARPSNAQAIGSALTPADPMQAAPRAAAASALTGVTDAPERRRSLVLTARHDRLDRGLDDWRAWRLDAAATGGDRTGVTGAVFTESRFGLDDHGVELGLVVPVREGWTVQPQLGVVPGAQFLPRRFGELRVEHVFGAGWVGAAAVRRSDYRDVRVERLALGVERYVGAWRAGYTATATRLRGVHAVGHDLRIARAYGADGGEIGVQFAAGREDALLGTQVVASDVRAWSIGGRHPLSSAWALRWNVGHVRQGALYARDGVALGLERRF